MKTIFLLLNLMLIICICMVGCTGKSQRKEEKFMKNILIKIAHKAGSILPAIALVLGIASVSGACSHWFHQPRVPEQMKKFK